MIAPVVNDGATRHSLGSALYLPGRFASLLLPTAASACDPQGYVAQDRGWYLLAGDNTAFPAIARILENLPEGQERGAKQSAPELCYDALMKLQPTINKIRSVDVKRCRPTAFYCLNVFSRCHFRNCGCGRW